MKMGYAFDWDAGRNPVLVTPVENPSSVSKGATVTTMEKEARLMQTDSVAEGSCKVDQSVSEDDQSLDEMSNEEEIENDMNLIE